MDNMDDTNTDDIIFERNRIVNDYGYASFTNIAAVGIDVCGRWNTIRNNIFDIRTTTDQFIGVNIYDHGAAPAPLATAVYNNTFRSLDTGGGVWYTGVTIDTGSTNIIARNNLVSFPNLAGTANIYSVRDLGTGSTVSNNLLTNTPYLADPDNVTPLSRDFHLTTSSTASIDQGYTVPVWEDFDGTTRIGETFDIGAYEGFGEPATCETNHTLCLTENDCETASWYWYSDSCHDTPYVPTCSDGIQNGDETGVDCGGSCSACEAVSRKRMIFGTAKITDWQ
jgi:hypothetical protein